MEVADSATGKAQKLIEESSNVWMSQKPVGWWKTEKNYCGGRSGTMGHVYLYDGQGKLRTRLPAANT